MIEKEINKVIDRYTKRMKQSLRDRLKNENTYKIPISGLYMPMKQRLEILRFLDKLMSDKIDKAE